MLLRRARALAAPFLAAGVVSTLCGTGVAAAGDARQVVPGARVVAIADRVAHAFANGDRTVAPAYQIPDQDIPAGDVALSAGGSPFVSATYVSVPVAIRVNGKLARTVVAGYRVTSYVQTAVAAHDLAPGSVLGDGDVVLARVPSNGRPAVSSDVLIGRKMSAAVAKGAPLYVEATSANPMVKPGQAAVLVVHDGPVNLTADVVARTGGALGEIVTVVNPQTQKAISGVVTGPNRVEITLPGGER